MAGYDLDDLTAMAAATPQAVASAASAVPGVQPVSAVRRIPKGHGHECWLVEGASGPLMVKFALSGATELSMSNLAEALRLADRRGVPCPRLLWSGTASAELGSRAMLIQEFLPGRDGEDVLADLAGTARDSYFRDWGAAVGRLHSVRAPCFSNSISEPGRCRSSWRALAIERLERLIPANHAVGVVPGRRLSQMSASIIAQIEQIDRIVPPSLVHCDLYPPNTLVDGDRFRALLDFEHAKFMDPVYDFVKLSMWTFEPFPEAAAPFWDGYASVTGRPERFDERFWVSTGLELLAGFPYWKRRGEGKLLEDYLQRLDRWFARS